MHVVVEGKNFELALSSTHGSRQDRSSKNYDKQLQTTTTGTQTYRLVPILSYSRSYSDAYVSGVTQSKVNAVLTG